MPRPKSVAWPKCCAHARGLGGSTARLCLWHSNGHARYRGHALGHVVRGVALDIIIRWEAFVLVEDNSDALISACTRASRAASRCELVWSHWSLVTAHGRRMRGLTSPGGALV
jgi:hypothetical protein